VDFRDCALDSEVEQTRFDALMEPSRHRNCAPMHRSIPPLLPEQGRLPAWAVNVKNVMTDSRKSRIVISGEVEICIEIGKRVR
jgi:hypothetical protein